MEEMSFESLDRIIVPITIGSRKFKLYDASEDAAVKFQNIASRAAKFTGGELSGIEGAANVEPLLVSMCLWEVKDGQEISISEGEIRKWPSRVVKPIFDKARKISGMDDDRFKTVQDVDKEIGRLQKRRAELVSDQTAPKDTPAPTAGNSN